MKSSKRLFRKVEQGRSLLEIIAVLVVIAILLIASILGYDALRQFWIHRETAAQIVEAGTRYNVGQKARTDTDGKIRIKDVMPESDNTDVMTAKDGGSLRMARFKDSTSFEVYSSNINLGSCEVAIRNGGYSAVAYTNPHDHHDPRLTVPEDALSSDDELIVFTPDCFTTDDKAKLCAEGGGLHCETVEDLIKRLCEKTQHYLWDPTCPISGWSFYYDGGCHKCPKGKVMGKDDVPDPCCFPIQLQCGYCSGCPSGVCDPTAQQCVECLVADDCPDGKKHCVDNKCYECELVGDDLSCPDDIVNNKKCYCAPNLTCVCCEDYQEFNPTTGECQCKNLPGCHADASVSGGYAFEVCGNDCGCDYGMSCSGGHCACSNPVRKSVDDVCNGTCCPCEHDALTCTTFNKCTCKDEPRNTAGAPCLAGQCECTGGLVCSHDHCCPSGTEWNADHNDCRCADGNLPDPVTGNCCGATGVGETGDCTACPCVSGLDCDITKHCCPTGKKAVMDLDGVYHCCESGKVWAGHTCCAPGQTEQTDGAGHYFCCGAGEEWKGHICCPASQVEVQHADGDWHCCNSGENWWKKPGSSVEKCCPNLSYGDFCTAGDCACTSGTCQPTYSASFGLSGPSKCCGTKNLNDTCEVGGCSCGSYTCRELADGSHKCCGNGVRDGHVCGNNLCPCTEGTCTNLGSSKKCCRSRGEGSLCNIGAVDGDCPCNLGLSCTGTSDLSTKCCPTKTEGDFCSFSVGSCPCGSGLHCSASHCCPSGTDWNDMLGRCDSGTPMDCTPGETQYDGCQICNNSGMWVANTGVSDCTLAGKCCAPGYYDACINCPSGCECTAGATELCRYCGALDCKWYNKADGFYADGCYSCSGGVPTKTSSGTACGGGACKACDGNGNCAEGPCLAEGASCPGANGCGCCNGNCSNGHCCPPGTTWLGSSCGTPPPAPDCVVDGETRNLGCQKCVSGHWVNQSSSDNCTECYLCESGSCVPKNSGTDCGDCMKCNTSHECRLPSGVSPSGGLCCSSGETKCGSSCCGGQCCEASNICCVNGSCTDDGQKCCPASQQACAHDCCAAGQVCLNGTCQICQTCSTPSAPQLAQSKTETVTECLPLGKCWWCATDSKLGGIGNCTYMGTASYTGFSKNFTFPGAKRIEILSAPGSAQGIIGPSAGTYWTNKSVITISGSCYSGYGLSGYGFLNPQDPCYELLITY